MTRGIHQVVFWHHPAIVTVFGVCLSPLSVIMERAALGCLSDYFQSHSKAPLRQSHLVHAAEDLAQALHYLVRSYTFMLPTVLRLSHCLTDGDVCLWLPVFWHHPVIINV